MWLGSRKRVGKNEILAEVHTIVVILKVSDS